MSARNRLPIYAFLAALCLTSPGWAQVSSGPLGQVDPWGVGWLGKAEGALPSTFWANTDAATLGPILASLRPETLSPAATLALRRVLLSSAKGPEDGAELIPERLRLIEQIGETGRSIDLRGRFPKAPWGRTADSLASELELATGRSETACARVADRRADDPVWMPVRALCYAIAGDFNAASMVGEQVVGADGAASPWLVSALETMREPTKTRPAGRYGSPFEVAVSVAAKLSVPANAFLSLPGDVALAVVRHEGATPDQKRAALPAAVETGKANPSDVLAVLGLPVNAPASGKRAAPSSRIDYLALASAAAADENLKPDARGTAFAVALKSGETRTDFRTASLALHAALKALPKSEATLAHSETFARASLVAGDQKLAGEWRALMDRAPDKSADPWAAARIDLMLSFAGVGAGDASAILDRLLASVPATPAVAAKASTPAQRQADLRRIENARALFLYVGLGRALTPEARAVLAAQKTVGRGVSDAGLARVRAANEAKAPGEAALAAIALVGSDASAQSFAGLGDILTELRRAGLETEANAIALEALQVWKAL
ncbi:MAG: hypothetical protein SGJ21_03170 [Alphaproteobacteria bacterium]|nr:hypothetical protein [Alphaproteobacteria bacterium]